MHMIDITHSIFIFEYFINVTVFKSVSFSKLHLFVTRTSDYSLFYKT